MLLLELLFIRDRQLTVNLYPKKSSLFQLKNAHLSENHSILKVFSTFIEPQLSFSTTALEPVFQKSLQLWQSGVLA